MLHFVVDKHLPLDSTDSPFFEAWLKGFAPMYKIPSRWCITNDLLHARYAAIHRDNQARIGSLSDVGINVDGWEDKAKRSLYAILFVCRDEQPAICDIVDLSGIRHTAENLMQAVESSVSAFGLSMSKVSNILTDSPSVMLKMRRDLVAKHPHLISAPCYLHWLGNLIRDIIAYPAANKLIKRNNELVHFFNGSHFWGHELRAWQKTAGVARWFRTNVETRWYSIGHLTKSVNALQYVLWLLTMTMQTYTMFEGVVYRPSL